MIPFCCCHEWLDPPPHRTSVINIINLSHKVELQRYLKTSQWPETQWKIPRISRIRFQCSRETIAENKKFAFGCCDQKSHNISFSQRSRVPVNLRQGSTWHRGNGQKIKRNKQQIKVCNRAHQKGNAYLTRRFCSPTSGHHSQDSTLCGTLGAKTGNSPDTTTLCPTKRDQAKIL